MLKRFRKNTHLPKCGLTFYSNSNPKFTQNVHIDSESPVNI